MAEEPRDRQQQSDGQDTERKAFSPHGQESQADRERSGQSRLRSPDATEAQSEQHIGGTDRNTGAGSTLTQGFEPDSLVNETTGDPERQEMGLIGAQGARSDTYFQQSHNPELSREDALDQQSDGGMGLASSESDQ